MKGGRGRKEGEGGQRKGRIKERREGKRGKTGRDDGGKMVKVKAKWDD